MTKGKASRSLSYQNDSWTSTTSTSNLENKNAQMIRFVQKNQSERTLFGIPNPPKTDFSGLFPSLICVQKSLSMCLMHPGTESEEGHSGSRWTHEFADANVCKSGCKRLHPRLQIFASGGPTISFLPVIYCKSAYNEPQNGVPPPATLVLAAWEASSSGLRGHFMPYSGALKCK